ncbi:class I lanthipeptide [Neolewinella agarilytica]|uniref:Thiazolylpeptide-type bacteriocin n=1 Tax=Neolewinella agarilytica TaxID=478744 RepID=A0A1H9KCT2_9BACT|nr:class I lanthipeptide [Neolewinella agarilytica]SEQ96960.1 hypothetical protein SAMN05444359_12051 [Neolewinella agarilytica]
MKNKDLSLDKERLARLQEEQLEATIAGADGPGSNKVDVDILRAANDDTDDGTRAASNSGSCCAKSCN